LPINSGAISNLELAELAMNSLRYRSLRSWLAVLGIVIGVGSVISLISISVGMNAQIQTNLGGVGANIITVSPGAARADRTFGGGAPPDQSGASTSPTTSSSSGKITFTQADALRHISGVAAVDAQISGRGTVAYRNKNSSLTVIGTTPSAFPDSVGVKILYGRTLGTSDTTSAVIGYSVATETFNESMLNKPIKINGVTFRVIGVLNQSGSTFSGPDRNIYITLAKAKTMFNQSTYVSSVVVLASDSKKADSVAANVTTALLSMHRLTTAKQDFTVSTASSLQSSISSVTNTLGLFLGGIASISLIVGGIGVANAMFTSVLEQTRYIGLLKSLGARNSAVLRLFIFEAGMVGLVGGVIGVALSFVGSLLLASFGLPSKITLELALEGLGFSIIVGVVSGLIPARNAASVAPVEALRYE
jgi:putative ABC transport system permease protein